MITFNIQTTDETKTLELQFQDDENTTVIDYRTSDDCVCMEFDSECLEIFALGILNEIKRNKDE